MNHTDNLFLLIKSLTKAEKRFFAIEASKYSKEEGNDYLLLYKLIEQQTDYDEEKIKKELKGNPLLKRLPSAKNYLHNLLLRTVTQLHREQNPHFQISNLLQEVDFLFFRGLFKNANKQLQKAKKIALDAQKISFLVIINEWEVILANFEPTFEKSHKKITTLQNERKAYLDELNIAYDLELFYEQSGEITYTVGKARTEEEKEVYRQLFQRKEILNAEKATSLATQSLLYAFKDNASFMLGDSDEDFFHFARKRVELFENISPELKLENAYYYASAVFGYLQALWGTGQKKIALEQLNNIDKYWKENEDKMPMATNTTFFFAVAYHSTKIAMLEGNFAKGVELSKTLKIEFQKLEGAFIIERALYIVPLNLGFCCFVRRSYDEALFWFRYILNDNTITIRPDVLGFVRILHLLVQHELNNKHILSYYADSTKRFLEKNNKLFQFEQLFLNFIKQLAFKTTWDSEYESILKKQKKKLQKLDSKNSFEKQYIQQYHLIEWIDSKIQQRPFEELILEKLAQQSQHSSSD